jgi:hypothetical protein
MNAAPLPALPTAARARVRERRRTRAAVDNASAKTMLNAEVKI